MNAIDSLLLQIIQNALLRIRNSHSVSRSAIEADHVHNIPFIIMCDNDTVKRESLNSYLTIDRASFVGSGEDTSSFTQLWNALETASAAGMSGSRTELTNQTTDEKHQNDEKE